MEKRYSKKRERIREYLKGTTEHPNAEQIYHVLKDEFPDLSLGTVYRNLCEMKSAGEIVSVGVVCDKERFDYCTIPHTHAVCTKCGKVVDLWDVEVPEETLKTTREKTGFFVERFELKLFGICETCKEGENV